MKNKGNFNVTGYNKKKNFQNALSIQYHFVSIPYSVSILGQQAPILTAGLKTDPSDWSSNRLVPPVGETRKKSSFKAFGDPHGHTRTRVSPGKHAIVKLLQCALAFSSHSQRFRVEMSGHTALHGLILLYSIHPLVLAEKPGK